MKILIKGAGDLATGVAAVLYKTGHQILMTEIQVPLTVRRQVAFSRAVYEKTAVVEGITGVLAVSYTDAERILRNGMIAVMVDPEAKVKEQYKPDVIVDAIIAKKNIGTMITDAPCVIALGPGFTAGTDCYAVIETMRGFTLGKPIYSGEAIRNTGVPGYIGGYAMERLIKAADYGMMHAVAHIGDHVNKGDILAYTGEKPVYAQIDGVIRGMLQDNVLVTANMKIGDVDPRNDDSLVYSISDKSMRIGTGVLEAIRKFFFSDMAMILLAAGQSKRYGRNKLLEYRCGKYMFQYAADAINAYRDSERIIVSRFDQIQDYAKEKGMEYVENKMPEQGISRSVICGLRACMEKKKNLKGVLFVVGDQPGLTQTSIEKILEMALGNPGKNVCASSNGVGGNPVWFDRKFFDELLELTGDTGGKQVLKKHPEDLLYCEIPSEELADIDISEDA